MNKLYFLTLLVLLAQIGQTQAQRITLNVNNVSLDTVFARIQEQTPYRFVYTSEELAGTRKVSFSVQKAPINTVLSLSFKDQPLDYSMEDPYIYVRKKEETKKLPPSPNQTTEIRGKITNELGDPLEGATVQVNKLGVQTLTNAKGEFVLRNIINGDYKLEITFIGYEKYTTIVKAEGNEALIVIAMKRIINSLDETVIKGYYNTTKKLNTGNVATVKGEDLTKQPVIDPVTALEGFIPGLYIQQQDGFPGGNISKLQIRGINSINSGTAPFFIIDGVPFSSTSLSTNINIYGAAGSLSPFNGLNSADIESIDVLKDADATAIYGSRGANGVILITTKKGHAGKTSFNMNVYEGYGKVTKTIPLMNSKQYLDMRREAYKNDGVVPTTADAPDLLTWDTTRNTNWAKTLIGGTAKTTNAQLALSGGNSATQFSLSGGYTRQTTVLPGSFNDQVGSVHFNLNHASINNKLHIILQSEYANDHNFMPAADPTYNFTIAPDAPALYTGSGAINWANSTWTNPIAALKQTSDATSNTLVGSLHIDYQFAKGVSIKTLIGYTDVRLSVYNISPLSAVDPAFATIYSRSSNYGSSDYKTWIVEPQMDYTWNHVKHTLKVLVGTSFQENVTNSIGVYGYGFTSDALLKNIALASVQGINLQGYAQYRLNKGYGRIGYDFDQKFLLNFTGSREGSSRFGPNKKFGNFGAIGVGYIFTKEAAIKKALPFVSFGKIRGSFGITGNDQIQDYQYLSTYSGYNLTYQGLTGLTPTSLTNQNYSWEEVKKLEVGTELGFLKDRVSLTVSYFRNRTGNQLVGYTLPAITGFSSVLANLPAVVQNAGFEFTVLSSNIKTKTIQWETNINVTIPRNKLVSYPNLENSNYAQTYAIGYPLTVQHVLHYAGLNKQTGIYSFVDVNKDNQITYPDDYATLKSVMQNYFGGIENKITIKAFQIDFLFQFVKKVAYNYFSSFGLPGTLNANEPVSVLNRWKNPGDAAQTEMYTQNYGSEAATAFYNRLSSDFVISDASFIRLRNLSLSYNVPHKLTKGFENIRIYIVGQNLLTFTHYLGTDPETQSISALPPLRIFAGGIQFVL